MSNAQTDRPADDDPGASGDRPSEHARERARRALTVILAELEEGHHRKAARLFSDAVARGMLTHGAELHAQLVRAIGEAHVEELVDGLSRRSCFYCKGGLEPCGECTGSGRGDADAVCPSCVGLGVARCDFCDGTGLASIDTVPEGLETHVLLERGARAVATMPHVLEQPLPQPGDRSPTRALIKSAQLLLDLNKLLGVLENTVTSRAELHVHATDAQTERLERIREACNAVAGDARRRAQAILAHMAKLAAHKAQRARPGSRKRRAAQSAALFYRRLSEDADFRGTSLEHPFLLPPEDG